MRVVIDTNVWVSAFLSPGGFPAQIISAWLDERFEVVISPPILEELEDVLSRPRLRTGYGIEGREDITRDPQLAARLKKWGIEPITVARFLALLEALE